MPAGVVGCCGRQALWGLGFRASDLFLKGRFLDAVASL